ILLTTSAAEFQVSPSGAVQAYLLKNGSKLTLDSQSPDATYLLQGDKKVRFTFDLDHATVGEASGKLGFGKRVDISGSSTDAPGLQATLHVEVYDDFPAIVLTSADYKNGGSADIKVDRAVAQQHRFDSGIAGKAYDMWSYQGGSIDWGKDDVLKLKKD